jgi:hypothetical protein
MLEITENIRVTCPNGHVFSLAGNDWDLQELETEEKPDSGMGNAICYPFRWVGACPVCGEEVEASIDAWEYPEGGFETATVSENVSEKDANKAFVAHLD